MKDVYYAPDELKQGQLNIFKDNIKPNRRLEDLLLQVFLDCGVDLSLSIAMGNIDEKKVMRPKGIGGLRLTGVITDWQGVPEMSRNRPISL